MPTLRSTGGCLGAEGGWVVGVREVGSQDYKYQRGDHQHQGNFSDALTADSFFSSEPYRERVERFICISISQILLTFHISPTGAQSGSRVGYPPMPRSCSTDLPLRTLAHQVAYDAAPLGVE